MFEASEHGLIHIYTVDMLGGDGCYEWEDITIFYRAEDQLFYWEDASGCSCYGSLDDVYSLDDLEKGTGEDLRGLLLTKMADLAQDTYRTDSAKAAITKDLANAADATLNPGRG